MADIVLSFAQESPMAYTTLILLLFFSQGTQMADIVTVLSFSQESPLGHTLLIMFFVVVVVLSPPPPKKKKKK